MLNPDHPPTIQRTKGVLYGLRGSRVRGHGRLVVVGHRERPEQRPARRPRSTCRQFPIYPVAWDGVYAMPAHCEINADRISMSGTGFGADVEAFGGGFFDRVR